MSQNKPKYFLNDFSSSEDGVEEAPKYHYFKRRTGLIYTSSESEDEPEVKSKSEEPEVKPKVVKHPVVKPLTKEKINAIHQALKKDENMQKELDKVNHAIGSLNLN